MEKIFVSPRKVLFGDLNSPARRMGSPPEKPPHAQPHKGEEGGRSAGFPVMGRCGDGNFRSPCGGAPAFKDRTHALRAFPHPDQAPVAAFPTLENFGVDAAAVVMATKAHSIAIAVDFHHDAGSAGMPKRVGEGLASDHAQLFAYDLMQSGGRSLRRQTEIDIVALV